MGAFKTCLVSLTWQPCTQQHYSVLSVGTETRLCVGVEDGLSEGALSSSQAVSIELPLS